jgi:hypothetical protein
MRTTVAFGISGDEIFGLYIQTVLSPHADVFYLYYRYQIM